MPRSHGRIAAIADTTEPASSPRPTSPWRRSSRALGTAIRRSGSWLRGKGPRRAAAVTGFALLTIGASGIGLWLGGSAGVDLGPFRTTVSVAPSVIGESEVDLPPLGALVFDSHDGPLKLTVRLDSLDQGRTQALITDPEGVRKASESVPGDLMTGVINVGLSALAGATLGGLVIGGIVYRTARKAALCGGLSLVVAIAAIGVAGATIRPQSVEEPRYEGLLANAPAVVGSAQTFADRYEKYRDQLQQFIVNMSQFYTIARTLPAFEPDPGTIRVLHVSDLHLNPASFDLIESVARQFKVDVVIDTGDITDWGSQPEAEMYTNGIARAGVPYVYIRGNHDSDKTVSEIAKQSNAVVLDDEIAEVAGLTIAGIGDPRFTPDKSAEPSDVREEQVLSDAGTELRQTILDEGGADVALVHDPRSGFPLADSVPLVLAGHRHERQVWALDAETLMMVEGSTGGAGLRGLQKATPVPLQMSVLYFSEEDKRLQAFDDIAVGGHGETEVTLQRHILADGMPDDPSDFIPEPPPEGEYVYPEPAREPEDD